MNIRGKDMERVMYNTTYTLIFRFVIIFIFFIIYELIYSFEDKILMVELLLICIFLGFIITKMEEKNK